MHWQILASAIALDWVVFCTNWDPWHFSEFHLSAEAMSRMATELCTKQNFCHVNLSCLPLYVSVAQNFQGILSCWLACSAQQLQLVSDNFPFVIEHFFLVWKKRTGTSETMQTARLVLCQRNPSQSSHWWTFDAQHNSFLSACKKLFWKVIKPNKSDLYCLTAAFWNILTSSALDSLNGPRSCRQWLTLDFERKQNLIWRPKETRF